MLSRTEIVKTCEAIALGAQQEIQMRTLDDNERFAVRGAILRAFDNFWYDVLTPKQRQHFDSREALLNSVLDAVF